MFLLLGIAVWSAFFISVRAILKAGARADAAAAQDEFALYCKQGQSYAPASQGGLRAAV